MTTTSIIYERNSDPTGSEATAVDDGLSLFNEQAADFAKVRQISAIARDPSIAHNDKPAAIIGGVNARTWGACCEIQQMWVSDQHRGHGVGARLLEEIETQARELGCTLLFLETFTFQAPGFYERHGFETACELPGFPGGVSKLIMRKSLL